MSQTAFLFPGQGAQYVGMARELVEKRPEALALFHQAEKILGYDLLTICREGPKERLDSTVVSQPAIYVASLAALEQLRIDQPEVLANCSCAAGLSLGEYTALAFAGVFSFEEGLRLVQKRGEAMQAAADAQAGAMVSVLLMEADRLEELVREASSLGPVRIANFLCPGNLVVSGAVAAVEQVQQKAEAAGHRCIRLAVAGAFHTELMHPADQQLAQALANLQLSAPRIPVWSNVDARPHTAPTEIRDLLIAQVVQPVRMEPLLRGLLDQGVNSFYELGPGKVMAGLLKRIRRDVPIVNIPA
jgi:[acyl-carrier-protein] S-malonyltransferase